MRFPSRAVLFRNVSNQAFTLIELLVVITIIAVLAGLLLPVGNKVIENAKKVTAKNALVTTVNAVKSYQAEYGAYPVEVKTDPAEDVTFNTKGDTPSGHNKKLMYVLRAMNNANSVGGTDGSDAYKLLNARRIVYLEYRDVKNSTVPRDGFISTAAGGSSGPKSPNGAALEVGDLVDPWGDMYGFRIDSGYSDRVLDPYIANNEEPRDDGTSESNTVRTAVIGWCIGKDGKFPATGVTFEASGNVATWK